VSLISGDCPNCGLDELRPDITRGETDCVNCGLSIQWGESENGKNENVCEGVCSGHEKDESLRDRLGREILAVVARIDGAKGALDGYAGRELGVDLRVEASSEDLILTPYASHTNSSRNIEELRKWGWRLLRTPFTTGRSNHGFGYALDNGAWRAHQRGEPFDVDSFERMISDWIGGADWIVAPDIVSGGLRSLELSLSWIERLIALGSMVLIPVQDGMNVEDVRPILSSRIGIFVGGSTEFKEGTCSEWGKLAREMGCYLHVGRVNTARRIAICIEAGADSMDGSGASKFSCVVRGLTMATRQTDIFRSVRMDRVDA